jgi:hypothetical protein
MPAYPSTPLPSVGSTVTPRNQIRVTDAEDGSIRAVSLWTSESYDVVIVHKAVTKTTKDTLESYYATNKLAQVDITWDGSTYNCRYVQKPTSAAIGGGLWTVTARFVGNKSGGG